MPVNPTYPGIYIEELPSSARTITAAPTSIAVFVGYTHPFKTKNFNKAVQIFNFTEYEREFGGLYSSGDLSADVAYAVNEFFLNGGSFAYIVGLQARYRNGSGADLGEIAAATTTVGSGTTGIVFTALELTDLVSRQVTVRPNSTGDRADIIVSYGSRAETYRGVTLNPSDAGETIRFGDGTFGELPNPGNTFEVTYRIGGGAIGNVAADAITRIDPTVTDVVAVTNPFPATGGADAESAERVRRLAPQAFRARQYRAVRAEDYQAAAQSLPWVQRAGTVFRWTGSWLTVFTTPDPLASAALTVNRQIELINLLNRYRLTGYESYVPSPRYISLELEIKVCARVDAFRGDVKASLLMVLSATRSPDGRTGFFHVDRWSFGQPLERSALEAAIQEVEGVAGVVSIRYKQRGVTLKYRALPETFNVPVDAILRVDNDNNYPERGSLKIIVEGGK